MTISLITFIFSILLCLILGLIVGKLISKQKVREKNHAIEQEEFNLQLAVKEAQNQLNDLNNQFIIEKQKQEKELKEQIYSFEQEQNNKNLNYLKAKKSLEFDIKELESKKELINQELDIKRNEINDLDSQAKSSSDVIERQAMEQAITVVEQQEKELYQRYEKLESELLMNYVELADSQNDEFLENSEKLNNQILTLENKIAELTAKAAAITAANKRAELERQAKDFYRLQLSDIDIEEIQRIRSIEPYLRKKEPLNKVIWKVYYEKPYTDLIGRVVGQGIHIGIYKITNLENGMVYVGQSNNIAERWKQHIKRGVGADPLTQNKLYPAMLETGVENFTFEILEECQISELNEREKYYQSVYGAQEFGYSIR